MEKTFKEYVKILPNHSDNLLNFYIFLAYSEKLTFYEKEEHDINSFFYRKSASIFLWIFIKLRLLVNDEMLPSP